MNKINGYFAVLFIALFTVFQINVYANVELPDVVAELKIGNEFMKINGVKTEIDEGRGTTPVIINNRTLLPVRAIIEAFGGTVEWDANSQSIMLSSQNDRIKLQIDSKTSYVNDKKQTLDVSPTIINERTMMPIRFIAENFDFGVAWDDAKKTVYIIRNSFDSGDYHKITDNLPVYSGNASIAINSNKPYFKDYEIIPVSFEYYSKLDSLGRCDVCMADVGKDIMPTEKRGDISSVKPTGWINVPYEFVDGRYLYNRCHLLGFQLTGENANKQNLITGTRYLNVDGMLPYENMVDDYVDKTGNHVLYRVSPVYSGDNLVADGVLMEAYSVEDNGKGLEFCVYCYNVQPGVEIDYKTGESRQKDKIGYLMLSRLKGVGNG